MCAMPQKAYALSTDEIQYQMLEILYGGAGGWVSCDFDGYSSRSKGRHEGIDFRIGQGEPIYALISGTITNTRNRSSYSETSLCGIYDSDYDKTVVYLHGRFVVSAGETVSRGQLIGYEDNYGAGSAHTHVEVVNGWSVSAKYSLISSNATLGAMLENDDPYPYWEAVLTGAITPDDNQSPVVTDFHVGEINDSTFTVFAHITDNVSIGTVEYKIWTDANHQDDIVTYGGHCTDGNDIYWARIPWSEHNGERGRYTIHLYAYDTAGNLANPGISYDFDSNGPVVSNFHVGELRDGAFTVFASIDTPNGLSSVRYAIWTSRDGQDDLKWYNGNAEGNGLYWARVNFSDHKSERGEYTIHLYTYDSAGVGGSQGITYTFDDRGPQIADIRVTEASKEGYTVHCTVKDDDGILRVQFPTWTVANGQDDIASDWLTNMAVRGTADGDTYSFRVNTSEHNGETGEYITHIYAWDGLGNRSSVAGPWLNLGNFEGSQPLYAGFADGSYHLQSKIGGRLLQSGSEDVSASITYPDVDDPYQSWVVTWNEAAHCYTIRNAATGKCLTTNGSYDRFSDLIQGDGDNSKDGNWLFEDAGYGWVYIRNLNGYYLDVAGADDHDGATVWTYTFNGGDAQKWKLATDQLGPIIDDFPEGTYTIRPSANRNAAIDVADMSVSDAANIQVWEDHGGGNQKFRFTKNDDGSYTITNVHSNKSLDVQDFRPDSGANVFQYTTTGTDNQRWFIEDAGDGLRYLRVKHSGFYLDLDYGKTDNGTNVQVFPATGSSQQKYVLEPVDTEGPVISDVRVTEASASGYTISCKVTDNVGATRVLFPTWTLANDQDDVSQNWLHDDSVLGTRDGDRWTFRVEASDHNGEAGTYVTHIYAWDGAGNMTKLGDDEHTLVDLSCRGDHDWDEWVTDKGATCAKAGSRHRLCKVCGAYESEDVPALGHDPLEAVRRDEVEPTCERDGGYDSVVLCGRCGGEVSREAVKVDGLGHDPADPVEEGRVEPTCTEAGSYDSVTYCSRCGEEMGRETIALPKADHDPAEPVEENLVEPTCERAGSRDMVAYCRVCGREVSRETSAIPAVGHSWDKGSVTTEPTCTEPGVRTFACAACGEERTEPVEATGHVPGRPVSENASAPDNCEAGGTYDEVVYCDVCGEELGRERRTQPAGQHVEAVDAAVAPTCTADGLTGGSHCSVCGAVLVAQEPISRTGHAEERVDAVAPTCTEPGATEGVRCRTCGEVLEGCEAIAARGHDYREAVVEPTCSQFGYTEHRCSRCGDSYVTDRVAAKAHTAGEPEVESEVPPACEATGSRTLVTKCSDCGRALYRTTEVVPATGHTAGEPEVESETRATCEAAGRKVLVTKCGTCGREVSRVVEVTPARGHRAGGPEVVAETPATCEAAGSRTTVTRCEACERELSRETAGIAATGHSWDAGTVTREPTCAEEGRKELACTSCGKRAAEAVPKAAHRAGAEEREGEVASTCMAAGHYDAVTRCADCGAELSRRTVALPLAEHAWGEWARILEPTWEREGMELRTCGTCNLSETRAVDKVPAPAKADLGDATIAKMAAMTYTGKALEPAVTVALGSKTLVPGTDYTVEYADNVNAGTATATVTGKGGYAGTKSATFTIARAKVKVPAANGGLTYSGKAQAGVAAGAGYKLGGTASATNAGSYVATATPDANHRWEDGTTGAKEVKWSIARASQSVTASNKSVTYGKTVSLGATSSGGGKLSYATSDAKVATVSATGVVTPVGKGTATITITAAQTTNHAKATKKITVTVVPAAQAVTAANKTAYVGKTVALGAKASGGGKLTYKSSGTAVATVSASGVVTGKKAGTTKVTVTAAATNRYAKATKTVTVTVKKNAQPMAAVAVTRTASLKTLKAKDVTVARPMAVTKAQGKVTYARVADGSSKCLTVNKTTGKVTVKKGTKKGTYKIKIKVTAAGNATYAAGSKTVICKVTVK